MWPGSLDRKGIPMPILNASPILVRREFLGVLCTPAVAGASSWTQFLGNGARSLDPDLTVPLEWSDDRNVVWRSAIPGYGQSSPVAFGGAAFTASVEGPHKDTLMLTAFDMAMGQPIWTHRSGPSQRIQDSDMVSKAAPTPAADASAVYVFFETGNVLAISHDGELLWQRQLTEEFGEFQGRHGIGSSLRLCGSGILGLVAHDGPSYLICLQPSNGETVWKTDRPKGVSWSTPTVVEHLGRELALVSTGRTVEGYDTEDGSLLWILDGVDGAFIASSTPVPGGAIVGSSRKGQSVAIRFGPTHQQAPEIVWRATEASSYFSSPLVHKGRVYMVNKAGVAFCLRADSGEEIWHSRLEGQCWASPIGLGDRVYFFGVGGVTEVVEAGDRFTRLARNSLSVEGRLYGTAVAEQGLLLRYGTELVRVAGA